MIPTPSTDWNKLAPAVTTACAVACAIAAYWIARTHVVGPVEAPRTWLFSWLGWPPLAAVAFAVGAYLLFIGLRSRQRERASAQWPTADGVIVATETVRITRYANGPAVICDYSVNGKQYRSEPIMIESVDASYFQPGRIMALHYDPDDPTVVVAGIPTAIASVWYGAASLGLPCLAVLVS